jgi:hypothetical protein
MVCALALCGWLCIFRTSKVVDWAQNNYRSSRITRSCPGSGMVMKPWYPTYLRCMGVYAWAFGLFILARFALSNRGTDR